MKALSWLAKVGQRRAAEYTIEVAGISILVTRKRMRYVRLKVHAPSGRVTISSPLRVGRKDVEDFAASRLDWIQRQQELIRGAPREVSRQFVSGETHFVWGQPRRLEVVEREGRQGVAAGDGTLTMYVRPGADIDVRTAVMTAWHKTLLQEAVPPLIRKWEERLNVRAKGYYLRRMKTRWGTCNYRTKHIRLNTELATKPAHLLDYVVAHEMVHLIVPNHGKRFVALMDGHYPTWRDARNELNSKR